MIDTCEGCGRRLTQNDVGIHKRLVDRGAERFLCRHCLAERFSCDVARIDAQIRRFRATGCTLFAPLPDGPEWAPWQKKLLAAIKTAGVTLPAEAWPDGLLPALAEGFAAGVYETVGTRFSAIAPTAPGLPDALPPLVAERYAALCGLSRPVGDGGRVITLCAEGGGADTVSLVGDARNAYCLFHKDDIKECFG